MNVEVLVVGDEILSGKTMDRNSTTLARALDLSAITLTHVTVVGDLAKDIQEAVTQAVGRSDALIVTGGLGPTIDDHTKEDCALLFEDPLELDREALEGIRARFAARGMVMPEINKKQAFQPKGSQKIPNPVGSAPGVHWRRPNCDVFLLPGVPAEMRAMFQESVLPYLKTKISDEAPAPVHVFRTTGLSESALAQELGQVLEQHSDFKWAFYPSLRGVDVRVRAAPESSKFLQVLKRVRELLRERVFSETDGETLEEVVAKLLVAEKHQLAVAESCTGGLLGQRLTSVAGSSRFFVGGFVTYSNSSKATWLGVGSSLLANHGAVSREVCVAMARGARERAEADLAVAITGIAGPSGGTPLKPVGCVFVALANAEKAWVRTLQLTRDRTMNRELAAQYALDMIRRHEAHLALGEEFGEEYDN